MRRPAGITDDIELFVESTVNRATDHVMHRVADLMTSTEMADLIREALQAAIDDVIPEMVAQAVDAAIRGHVADKHYWKSQDNNDPFRWAEAQQKAKIEVDKYKKK